MPVTAKLSRKFYERFGDEIATEFVDWFNAVDSTWQNQFRESNELNWERFKGELRAEAAAIRAEMHAVEGGLRAELHAVEAGLRAEFRIEFAKLRQEMAEMKGDLLKWMFVYWTGTILTIGGLLIALKLH